MKERKSYLWLLVPLLCGFAWGFSQDVEVAQATINHKLLVNGKNVQVPEAGQVGATGTVAAKKIKKGDKELRKLVYLEYEKYHKKAYGRKRTLRIIRRMENYSSHVNEAGTRYGYEPNLLIALAGVESAGKKDIVNPNSGAVGLFQLLELPRSANRDVKRYLGKSSLSWYNPRHNTLLGAATLKDYSTGRKRDLLLGLVGFNWGPNRKTLKGKTSFGQVKDNLPSSVRSYPLQVLALFLAIESMEKYGKIVPYDNEHIAMLDKIVLPGIDY